MQPFPRISTQRCGWRREQITIRLAVAAPHAAAHLVQVGKAKLVRPIDKDGVGVRNVQARLYYIGRNQHVVFAINEFQHCFFQAAAFHLSVRHANPGIGHKPLHHVGKPHNIADAVMDEKNLSAPPYFFADGIADHLFAKRVYFGGHGLAVGRRRGNDGQIARTHQRKMQGARNRGGRQREHIHIDAHFLEPVFGFHAEFLFLINYKQAQVLECHIFAHNPVRANQDVYVAIGYFLQRFLDLLRTFKAVHVFHAHRKLIQPLPESLEMLHGQHRGGH